VPAESPQPANLLPVEPEVPAAKSAAPKPAPPSFFEPPLLPSEAPPTEPEQPWQQELAERVENFRRRRARMQGQSEDSDNLEFDFGRIGHFEESSADESKVLEFPDLGANLDVEFGDPSGMPSSSPFWEVIPLKKGGGGSTVLDSAAVEAGEVALERDLEKPEPVEMVVGFSEPHLASAPIEARPLLLPLAPLGRRFLAELADALVLLLGAGLFALTFWFVGGHLTPGPLNIAVLAFIAAFFLFAYFGLFTALTSATPGLLWMGLEVRNMEGLRPTTPESFWRAFGYLVSIAALMLGFVWALVDGEALTWHDRMSGTFLTFADQESTTESMKSEL